MNNGFDKSLSFFKIISGVVAVVPGLLVLKEHLPLPPEISVPLTGVLVEISCCFIVAYAWLNKTRYLHFSQRKFNHLTITSFIVFGVFLIVYGILQSTTTIDSQIWKEKMFVPIFADVSSIKEHSFQGYYDEYGPADLVNLLKTHYALEVLIAKIIVYIVFCLTFTMLTTTFTLLWLNKEAEAVKQNLI
jgi:hypothetical protein